MISWFFDALLAASLLWLGWRVMVSSDLLQAVVLFILLGLVMALCWARLAAPDLALAEAAINAGLTGALLLANADRFMPSHSKAQPTSQVSTITAILLAVLCSTLAVGLTWALLITPSASGELSNLIQNRLAESGVSNPVTAVLLNFRGYDTLLEMAVLLMALLGVASLVDLSRDAQNASSSSPEDTMLLESMLRFVLPLAVLSAAYLLWAGAHAPGGAFQAGAVLAGLGVLLKLTDRIQPDYDPTFGLRLITVLGPAVFCLIALGMLALGQAFLEYPRHLASTLILAIESTLTLSIGLILTLLFAAAPGLRRTSS